MIRVSQPAWKQAILTTELGLMYPGRQSRPGLLCDLKLYWSLSFLLHHDGSRRNVLSMGYVPHKKFG